MPQQFRLRFLAQIFCVCITVAVLFFPVPVQAIPAPVSVLLQINRLAGSTTGTGGFSGDAGPALLSVLQQPEGVAIDGAGNLYIADTGNNRIRRIDAATGVITTVAGDGQQGYNGDGLAISVELNQPGGVTIDAHGNLYIADTVTLSCANLIQGATCQFSSSTVLFVAQTQTPQTVALIIDPNTVVTSGFSLPAKGRPILQLFLLLMGFASILLPFFSRRRSASLGWGRLLVVIFCLGLGSLSGCANRTVAVPVSDGITVQASMPSSGVITTAQLQVYMAQ